MTAVNRVQQCGELNSTVQSHKEESGLFTFSRWTATQNPANLSQLAGPVPVRDRVDYYLLEMDERILQIGLDLIRHAASRHGCA